MSEIPFGPDGFVEMDALPPLDPDEALTAEVYDRLHEALVGEPVRVPSESRWDAMLETALHEPASMETDWLVPEEAPGPGPGEIDAGSMLDDVLPDAGHQPEGYDDVDWPDLDDQFTDLDGDGIADDSTDEGDPGGDDLL